MENNIINLKKFQISGFKALRGSTFNFPNRSLVLIGGNGSGKSSTLQALALVREFAYGDARKFFDDRGWSTASVKSRVVRSSIFIADLLLDAEDGSRFLWQFDWGLRTTTNRREIIWYLAPDAERPSRILDHNPKRTVLHFNKRRRINSFKLPGSVLAYLDFDQDGEAQSHLREIAKWAQNITSLEMLSPSGMRRGARGLTDNIGLRGERLTSFLASLDAKSKSRVVARLKKFYPIQNIETTRKRAGWVDMRIAERFTNLGGIGPSHVSDGLLRLLALCAIPEFDSHTSLVLLDEIEDGIEPHILPEIIEKIVTDSGSQFIFTSHSPLLVNFFEPTDIHVLARLPDGAITTSQFSEFSSWQEGLEYFGPGEIWSMAERNAFQNAAKRLRPRRIKEKVDIGRFSMRRAQALMAKG